MIETQDGIQTRGKAFFALLYAATDYQVDETAFQQDYRWNLMKIVETLDFECDDDQRVKFEKLARAFAESDDDASPEADKLVAWIIDALKPLDLESVVNVDAALNEILEHRAEILD